jgi:hypothetical protein
LATHSEAGLLTQTALRAYEVWYPPLRPAHSFGHKVPLHDYVAHYIGVDADIRYLEFGVHSGWSIQRFATLFTNPDAQFFGFDSFIGLPESWGSAPAGYFSTDGRPPETKDSRIQFVKGWFQNSVREFLPQLKDEPPKTTLVHFDADLYSSTLFLLASLWWYVPEYYFIMDEFMGHEMAATRNFVSAFPVDLEFYSRVDNKTGHPSQIFGRMRATKMVVDGVG